MTSKNDERLAGVKRELAEKYERLARCANSAGKRKQLKMRADRFRRQAEQLSAD
jgi:hypothetical protein